MKLKEFLIGKTVIVQSNVGKVELVIKEIESIAHEYPIEEANSANDWWPQTSVFYTNRVWFTNGHSMDINIFEDLELLN